MDECWAWKFQDPAKIMPENFQIHDFPQNRIHFELKLSYDRVLSIAGKQSHTESKGTSQLSMVD